MSAVSAEGGQQRAVQVWQLEAAGPSAMMPERCARVLARRLIGAQQAQKTEEALSVLEVL